MLRFLTAGESHGPAVIAVVDGLPAGLRVDAAMVDEQLRRRQGGYGRGRRMAIEFDRVEILSGVRAGETLGGPVTLMVRNRDWVNWQQTMHVEAEPPDGATGARRGPVTRPRPGHADLSGALKYERRDMRDVLERASARETTARVAVGALASALLAHFDVHVLSHVWAIGSARIPEPHHVGAADIRALPSDSRLRCVDPVVEDLMVADIDRAREAGDTLGGAFEVLVIGVPVGLGSHVQWDRKLDGRLAQALMSIQAIKGVGVGVGPDAAFAPGSRVHDEIVLVGAPPDDAEGPPGLARPTNRAGGLEGGITNGQPVRVSAFMKPISTLMKPLRSVNVDSMTEAAAAIERSDVCAVPAASVVGEAMVAIVMADAFLEKFGGDSVSEIGRNYDAARESVRRRLTPTTPLAST